MATFSIIICSHKAPPSLWECLQSISKQSFLSQSEVVLVNNGFSQDTENELRAAFSTAIPGFTICREEMPGLGYARARGFRQSSGQWLVLLDDDNTVAEDFLARLHELVLEYPTLGGITPAVYPIWQRQPPAWLEGFGTLCLSYNSTDSQEPESRRFYANAQFESANRPPGGGMIIHRSAVDAYLQAPKQDLRLGLARTANSLVGCEDADLWSSIAATGRDVLECNRLKVYHHIPSTRLKLAYLLRLNFQMQSSYCLLRRLSGLPAPAGSFFPALLGSLIVSCKLLKIAALHSREHPLPKQLLLIAQEWGRLAGTFQRLPKSPQ